MVMRLLMNTLIAVMLVAVLGAVLLHLADQRQQQQQLEALHRAMRDLHRQALFHAAMEEVEVSETGFPLAISPQWFREGMPLNTLVPPSQPWLDIAPEGDTALDPPDPVIERPDQAGFWYNPQRGVIRARVLPELSEQATLRRYNQANGTELTELPGGVEQRLARQPQTVIIQAVADSAPRDPESADSEPVSAEGQRKPAHERQSLLRRR